MIKARNSKISSRIAGFALAGAVITLVVVGLIPSRVEGVKISETKRQTLDKHEARIGALEKSIKTLKTTVARLQSTTAKSDARMRKIEKMLSDLSNRLNELETRPDNGKKSRRDRYAK